LRKEQDKGKQDPKGKGDKEPILKPTPAAAKPTSPPPKNTKDTTSPPPKNTKTDKKTQ
jgi:hypothetical protein